MRLLLVLLSLSFGSAAAQDLLAHGYQDPEGYAVIRTLLKSRLARDFSREPDPNKTQFPKPIVINLTAANGSRGCCQLDTGGGGGVEGGV